MSTIVFVALASGSQTAGYRATLPDLPDCVAEAADLSDLLISIRQAATDRLKALADAGEDWPHPRPPEAIPSEPGAMAILVDIAIDDPPVRVNISLGEKLVQRLDAAAEARGMTRSGFIAQAVKVSLGERTRGGAELDANARRLQDELSNLGRKINDSLGPESAFSRRMAELDDRVYDGVRRAADSVSAAMTRRREATVKPADGVHGFEPPPHSN